MKLLSWIKASKSGAGGPHRCERTRAQSNGRAVAVFDRAVRMQARVARDILRAKAELQRAIECGDFDAVVRAMNYYQRVLAQWRLLCDLLPFTASAHPTGATVLSSFMLRDTYERCTATPDEGMVFVLGVDVHGDSVGTHVVELPYSHRSITGAGADVSAMMRTLAEAHQAGHSPVVLGHSHPGDGPEATHPSSTDLRTHAMWERTTPLIGAIWSRDGFLRAFSAGRPFNLTIIGNHLEQLDEHLWRLQDVD